ncbi:MAG: tyrosine-type recombinase/integrase [Panacagrimonas sp.]
MSRGRRLTDAVVAACVATSKEYSIRDAGMKGLSLRVQPSGAKTWVLRGHLPDRTRRTTVGDARLLTVDQASARAHVLLSHGEAPPPPPVEVSPRFREFAKLHRARRKDQWKKTTLQSYDSYMKSTLLPAFRRKRLSEITRATVARWFHKYSRRAPGGANRALDVLKELFNRAKEWEAVPVTYTNPCLRIKRNRRPPRGRLLNHDALTKLGAALDRYAETRPDIVDAIRLILLTGCRSGEIHRLRWVEVLPDRLELQSAKTGPRTVRIGTPALKLLERRRQSASASATYVFAHHRNSKRPLMEISETWKRIREAAGLPNDIRLHDLRHTFASHAVMNGETMLVTGALLGHRKAESTVRYAHLNDAFLLKAAEKVARQIQGWMAAPHTRA